MSSFLTGKSPFLLICLVSTILACRQSNDQGTSLPNSSPTKNIELHNERSKRSSPFVAYGKSTSSKARYVELYVATDVSVYKEYKKDVDLVTNQVRTVIQSVNALFLPIQVHIVLVGLDIWKDKDKIEITTDPDKILQELTSYRVSLLDDDIKHDATLILTNIDLDGDTVGKALVGTMCERNLSVSVVQMTETDAATIAAHELGHLLGMKHDEDGQNCTCDSGVCIMANSTKNTQDHLEQWSNCSIKYLDDYMQTGFFKCLENLPKHPLKPPLCGDGLLQEPEECDCGPVSFCDNPCCNPKTCKLNVNATCAVGLCCDTETCNYKAENAICREAENECDLPEFCSGYTEVCPTDVFLWNGAKCDDGSKGHCWNGLCRSRETSCRKKYGDSSTVADEVCYNFNGFSNDCVKSYKNGERRCSKECGKLLCHTDKRNKHVERGYQTQTIGSKTCYNIIRDGIADLVDEGSPCEDGNVCQNYRCAPISQSSIECDSGCYGRGRCNTNGNCHCDDGYSPPDCRHPGNGGSIDSNGGGQYPDTFKIVMILLFVVIIPSLIILWCVIVNSSAWWNHTGRGWTKSWSPCCSTCLDSCCCPIVGMVAEKVDINFKPGTKFMTKHVSRVPQNNNQAHLNQPSRAETTALNPPQNRNTIISDSPVPNVRFFPISNNSNPSNVTMTNGGNELSTNNANNLGANNSNGALNGSTITPQKSKKKFTLNFWGTPIPGIKFFPIKSASSASSLASTISTSTNVPGANGSSHPPDIPVASKPIQPVRPAPTLPPASSVSPAIDS